MSIVLKSFTELDVWKKAHGVVLDVYQLTTRFPDGEKFGTVSQLRRAAASVPANIAEGFGRRSTKEFLQSLAIANGSLQEVRYFLILSRDLKYLTEGDFERLDAGCDAVGRMITALRRSLNRRNASAESSSVTSRQSRVASHG